MGLFWAKYARRIFAIVSTTSIPDLAPVSPTEATVDPPSRGSRLDADHPENGVLIPRRFTVVAWAASCAGGPSCRGGRRAQPGDQRQDVGEHLPRDCDLGHLEPD